MTDKYRRTPRPKIGDGLTAREVQVMGLLTQGMTNKEIGDRAGISEATVKFHIWKVGAKMGMTKFGAGARVLMAVKFIAGEVPIRSSHGGDSLQHSVSGDDDGNEATSPFVRAEA